MVYLIHLDEPYKHAQHYLGYTGSVYQFKNRMERHRSGTGSRLLQIVGEAGIEWSVVRVWPDGDRELERRLKQHSSTRYCPCCNKELKDLLYEKVTRKKGQQRGNFQALGNARCDSSTARE